MAAKIKISPLLKQSTDNQDTIEVQGNTVKECLDDLIKQFPGIKKWIFNNMNELTCLVIVNGEALHRQNLNQKITAKDQIQLSPIIRGG